VPCMIRRHKWHKNIKVINFIREMHQEGRTPAMLRTTICDGASSYCCRDDLKIKPSVWIMVVSAASPVFHV
jgi:hypothetical protein